LLLAEIQELTDFHFCFVLQKALDLFEEMKMRNLSITVVSYGSAISACDKGMTCSMLRVHAMIV